MRAAVIIEDLQWNIEPAVPISRILTSASFKQAFDSVSRFEEVPACAVRLGLLFETLISIHGKSVVEKTKKANAKNQRQAATYCKRWRQDQSVSLVRLAREYEVSPVMFARLLLPELQADVDKRSVGQLLKNTSQIVSPVVRNMVVECMLKDHVYSPLVERVKEHVGQEWEYSLLRHLDRPGMFFQSEDQMRAGGYAKTPDVFFSIPQRVTLSDGRQVIATWIDSKASFGDEDTMRVGLRDQLMSYRYRFGPGIVVFFFGHVDQTSSLQGIGITVTDALPVHLVPAE